MYEPVANNNGILKTIQMNEGNKIESSEEQITPPEKPPRKHRRKHSGDDNNKGKLKDDTIINVDHINIETINYKIKHIDVSVQTSPLIAYRLRFFPRTTCDLKCAPNENNCGPVKLAFFCRIMSQWCLSQIGLTIIVILWALLGAFAFYKTEGPRETRQMEKLAKIQNEISIELSTVLRQIEEHPESWPFAINKFIRKHENYLLDAVSAGYGEGGGGNIWTYPGCILFAVALLTTLGFGAPVPRTVLGRGAAVLFSAIGIPLHFLLVLNMGNLMAVKLQKFACKNLTTDIPTPPLPIWLKWFPFLSISFYYFIGVVLFGFIRQRDAVDCFMFPLDFTAAGGLANTYGHVRIFYALYLEVAVTLAAMVVSLLQASATKGIVDVGLRLGLLTNT